MGRRQIVLIHGFTQNAASYRGLSETLFSPYELHIAELPGHGDKEPLVPGQDSRDVALEISSFYGKSVYVGYSMGARIALRIALEHPGSVAGLVLISATAGIQDQDERLQRRLDDERLAKHIREVPVEVFIKEWLAGPLFAHLTPEETGLKERCQNNGDKMASALLALGQGNEEPMWDLLPNLAKNNIPVLILVGANDEKYVEIGRRLHKKIGAISQLDIIDNCGHSVLAEQPIKAAELIMSFIAKYL
jgi:2-succinyl-6-hydroxy-2,4-cyclohexadiene-1-carboxylate synthase